jgi:multiple sugar transport system substrate-binding protein
MHTSKWPTLLLVAALMLLLSACAQPVPPTVDTEAQAQITELEAQLAEAQASGGASEDELADLQAQLEEAQMAAEQAAAEAAAAPAEVEETPPWAPLEMEDFTSADIDWEKPVREGPAEGILIHVPALSHPYINALRPYVPLFEELTGIEVAYDILPVEEYWTKTAADLQGGTGFYDLIQTGTEYEWGYQEAGWVVDLNEYLNDPDLTDLEWYDIDDFYPYDWNAHAWNGEYGIGTYGMGRQNAVPVNAEPLMMICNQEKLDEAGLPGPPTTWEEWAEYAEAMTGDGEYGVVQRGARDYSLMYGYAPGFFAYAQYDLDPETLVPVFNCPECAEYTQLYGDTLRNFGPPGQTNIGWDGVISNMAAGTTGCTIDDMAFADTYENPEASQIAGKVVYSNPPAGPQGDIRIPVWYWAWSINAASSHPDAAWLFLEWATSKPVMTVVSAEQHAMLPVRASVWESEDMIAITEDWGNYREAIDGSREYWGNFYTVQPHMVAMTGPWVVAIQETILGEQTAQEALDAAVIESEKILQEAGLYD